jgi:hypothetical protein
LEVIAPRAKFTFDPDDVDGLRAAIERAVRSLGSGRNVSSADLLYNPSVSNHVDCLLRLARRIHGGDTVQCGDDEEMVGDAA